MVVGGGGAAHIHGKLVGREVFFVTGIRVGARRAYVTVGYECVEDIAGKVGRHGVHIGHHRASATGKLHTKVQYTVLSSSARQEHAATYTTW